MADQQRKKILVYSHPSVLKEPILMGTLNAAIVRGKEIFAFEYNSDFLESDSVFEIDPEISTPPMTSLRELEHATVELEQDVSLDDEEYLKRLSLLIAPGSSLGGARPKASVKSENDQLWIAKFPSKSDEVDIGAWEFLVYKLALKCGIDMSESKAEKFYSDQTTFLTRRFDRDGSGRRNHFFSAMTLLGYRDGADAGIGVSYLELLELILTRGTNVEYDTEQLWRRIVFNILVSNTDDHLRNHGFLLEKNGITLSPAYDINPNSKGYGLNLNIDENDNRLDTEIARSVAPFFRLSDSRAIEIIDEMKEVVSGWRKEAEKLKITRSEIELMVPAFLPKP